MVAMVLSSFPLPAQAQQSPAAKDADSQPSQPAAPAKANRTVPKVAPAPALPAFSADPSDEEIFRARIFGEPLVPTHTPASGENAALAAAIIEYLSASSRENVASLDRFLEAHPGSAWRLALLVNLGTVYRRTGYFSRALAAWEEAWHDGKHESDVRVRALVDRAAAEIVALSSRLGRREDLIAFLHELEGRPVGGSAAELIALGHEALAIMASRPDRSFRCGPLAVTAILRAQKGSTDVRLDEAGSTTRGTSLLAMAKLATSVGLGVQMAWRSPGAEIPVPSMVHWKSGHFGALVQKQGSRYLLQDPTFGEELWISKDAIGDESSGAFLIPGSKPPAGWRTLNDDEATGIWGKGLSNGPDTNAWGPPTNCNCPPGMAGYSLHKLTTNIQISDHPIQIHSAVGPSVDFTLSYNNREVFQPQIPYYGNFGSKWTHSLFAWIEDDPNNANQTLHYYRRGGGREPHLYNAGTGQFSPHFQTRAVVTRVSSNPIRYERKASDGSVEVFAQPDGGFAFPRKVLLTEMRDKQGNALVLTYDGSLRLVAVTGATGQVSLLSYGLSSDPLKITRITDPQGRYAEFGYDGQGRLISIRDVIGLTSEFTYEAGDFISELRTPYGTTRFKTGVDPLTNERWSEVTDPIGGKERISFINGPMTDYPGVIPPSSVLPASEVPSIFASHNHHMNFVASFYWDKRAMAVAPGDRASAEITNWMIGANEMAVSSPRSIKKPLESRVWYEYRGSAYGNWFLYTAPAIAKRVGRLLDDGSTQVTEYDYNDAGLMIKEIDPLLRQTTYVYGTSNQPDANPVTGRGVDLLEVRKKNTALANEVVVASYLYDRDPAVGSPSCRSPQPTPWVDGHLLCSATDGAGQTTSYTYNAQGQTLTVQTPPRAGITENRITSYAYDASTGDLLSVTGPGTPPNLMSTYTYDGLGRLATVTDVDGYQVSHEYDSFDRLVKTSYPDQSFEVVEYDRLDPVRRRDRLGRWSYTFYDGLRRVVSTRDPEGRTVNQVWCTCGSLDKLIDPNGNATTWERDVQGRVTKEIRANASFKTFQYEDRTSRLEAVIDAKSQEIHYTYALDDKLLQVGYVNEQIATPDVSFNYVDPVTTLPDPHGRLRSMTDGTGATTYSYHAFGGVGGGQLSTLDGPLADDATITYVYDELGRVVSRTLNGVTTTWAYDALGRLTTLGDPIGNFTYGYVGSTGRVGSVTYPNGQTTSYAYLPVNQDLRLQEIHHKKPGGITLNKFNYTHDVLGNILTWAQQTDTNPAQTYTYEYDRADQLTAATLAAATPKRYRYAYDLAGNRTAEQVDDVATAATYDNMNRLLTQVPGGAMLFRGTTNEPAKVTVQSAPATTTSSNQFSGTAPVSTPQTDVVVQATDYASPTPNVRTNTYRVTQSGSTKNFTYDPNGNMTGDGTKTYEWDAENRLLTVKQGAATLASLTYDGEGRRATKTAAGVTTSFVYDGAQFLEERPSAGSTKRYIYGPAIDQPLAQIVAGTTTYNVADHLGSTVHTTDTAGNVTLSREYDPWGNALQGAGVGGYAFTGREWDAEIGLYYYRARYYDPKIGRFIGEDPVGYVSGPNPYSYVGNNPAIGTDPTGQIIEVTTKTVIRSVKQTRGGTPGYTYVDWRAQKAPCGQRTNSCWGFDANVDATIVEQFSQKQSSPSSNAPTKGKTLRQHEDLHAADFRNALTARALNAAIKTEGFGNKADCDAAWAQFGQQLSAYLSNVAAASAKKLD